MDPIVKVIPVSQILPSPHQARKAFDAENLKGLAESMKQEGLLNPVVVRKVAAGFELISGERRLRAAKLLGWPALEAKVIGTVSEAEAAAKGLIENIQREDLNTIEEAEGYKELNRLDPKYWTQNKIAQNCGKTQGHVSEFLRFLTLPEIVKGYIRRRILSAGHAAELIRIHKANAQKTLAHKIIKGKWSVMQTRDAIDRKLGKKPVLKLPSRVQPKVEDPLSDAWLFAKENAKSAFEKDWNVDYGVQKTDFEGITVEGWTFTLPNSGDLTQKDLARWFRSMAEALDPRPARKEPLLENGNGNGHHPEVHGNGHKNGHTNGNGNGNGVAKKPEAVPIPTPAPAPAETPTPAPRVVMMGASSQNEFEILARERANLRLPKTREEEAELEALSAKGLYAVYQWIYGTNSLTAQKVQGRTWAEWGVGDPVAGTRGIINALKKIQETSKF
jgi:ParB family transcriptional regulator, chromosome partitioning protein